MRINLTKQEIVNSIYMQIGYSKKIAENLLEDFFDIIFQNLKENKKVKIAKFGTFEVRFKKSRIGRNPKTKENKIISERQVILFKPSKELKKKINAIFMKQKIESAYKTIGEVSRDLGLINRKTGKLNTHTVRYWEKEFKQIKPKIFAGKRRYYDKKQS